MVNLWISVERCKISREMVRWTTGKDYRFFRTKCCCFSVRIDAYITQPNSEIGREKERK